MVRLYKKLSSYVPYHFDSFQRKNRSLFFMHIKLVAINGRFTHSCLALFHLRNELEANCHMVSTEIVQKTIRDPAYEVLLDLSRGQPDAIFFSAAVWNSHFVQELIVDLHLLIPSCQLVVGGPQAEVIGCNLKDGVCTVVRGAIEAVEERFYHDLANQALVPRYGRSFFHLTGKNERFLSPYKKEDFETHLKNRNVYYESSRGCPFSCSYCLSSAENGTVHKNLTQIREELDLILSYETRVLRFVDRTFNDQPERALAIWRLVLSYDCKTLFHFEVAPDRISDRMFDFLATVPPGRFQFEIGIQSTNEATLAAINRRIDPEVAHDTVSRLAALDNIHLHADLILGLPYETKESFLRSFNDIFAMAPHYIQMGVLKLLPDTELGNCAEEYGYRACSQPPYTVMASEWLDPECLQDLYWFSECVEKFCNNRYFPSLWRYIRNTETDASDFFMGLLEVARQERLFELAATQELLCRLLMKFIQSREDRDLMQELIIYDWLRCGRRKLPNCLVRDGIKERSLKDALYLRLPSEIAGLYSQNGRNRFFKQCVFYKFSGATVRELGYCEEKASCLVFLPGRENSLMQCQEVALLPPLNPLK